MTTLTHITHVLLALHIAAGSLAVVGGLVALCVPKFAPRTRDVHRRAGRAYLRCMQVVIGSAAVLTLLKMNAYFAGLTAAAAIGTFSGTRVLRRKRPDLDPRQRATALDWGVTLLLLAVAVVLLTLAHAGRVTRNMPVVLSLGWGTAAYALYDLWRFWKPTAWPFGPNLWLYEHLVKMIGAYSGAVSAFSGSVLLFLDPPWRQLWASAVGETLCVILVLYYRRARRVRSTGPAAGTVRTLGRA